MNVALTACQSHSEDVVSPPLVAVFIVNILILGET